MPMMIAKMLGLSLLYVIFTIFVWYAVQGKKLTAPYIIIIGIFYGIGSILSTHFGVNYGYMMLNVRDIGPLAAGFFFHPVSGIIAGLIGGIERYIVGTYFGVGEYTRVACAISTCLAGFLTLVMRGNIFKDSKPTPIYAFFIGAVMEVFHMYAVFLTHSENMDLAFRVVRNCAAPMIIFTAIGMCLSSCALLMLEDKWRNPFKPRKQEEIPIASTFQKVLFITMLFIIGINFATSYFLQSQTSYQYARNELRRTAKDIREIYEDKQSLVKVRVGSTGAYSIYRDNGYVISGYNKGGYFKSTELAIFEEHEKDDFFNYKFFGTNALCRKDELSDGNNLIVIIPTTEIYRYRDAQIYENALANVLLFASVFFIISFIVKFIVVEKIDDVNNSLAKITAGDLNEVVNVRSSTEFSSLSDDINDTVDALKGYIDAAEKRMAEELEFASSIQMSALPRNFKFPSRYEFEIFALMDAAKEVGGDFYDFFFVDGSKFALVIADVAGKGIPAALFMMRSKTAIRGFAENSNSPAEILDKVNDFLCDGNEAEMFVTVWFGIIDLKTGEIVCANSGHEYPIILRAGKEFEIYKDVHTMPLAAMEHTQSKEYKIKLNPGDKIFVYTDGVPEAINRQKEQYGDERLISILNKHKDTPLSGLLPIIRKDVSDFADGAEQFDDITMLGFVFNNYLKDEEK